MQINLSKFVGVLTGITAVGLLGFFGYFMYLLFFVGPEPEAVPSVEAINPSSFGDKLQKAAVAAKNKNIYLSKTGKINISYTDQPLFNSFTEVPDPVPLTDTRGRDDPFVPYVAP